MNDLREEAERKYEEVGKKLQETKEEAERRLKETLK
jgi:hypothetical protein